jgi:uncharacterized membrane protein YfcA
MNGLYPGNWQNSLRGIAATAVLVAIGFYIAITLIQAIAKPLIGIVVVAAALYGIVRIERYRRSRW